MNTAQMIAEMIEFKKRSLNPKSKWFTQDLQDYTDAVKRLSAPELLRAYNNIRAMNDKNSSFNKTVNKEILKMQKAGMYDVSRMSPKNALD